MKYIYPTLLKSANTKYNHGWFDVKIRKNKAYNKKKKRKKKIIESVYIDTYKIKLELNYKQQQLIKLWLDDCIDIYNLTNDYIKTNINIYYGNCLFHSCYHPRSPCLVACLPANLHRDRQVSG